MSRLLISAALAVFPFIHDQPGPAAGDERLVGYISQYAERPSRATLEYRIAAGDIVAPWLYDGFVAVADCGRIGHEAWLSIEGGPWLRTAVFDCAGHAETVAWMAADHIIAEIDYSLADRLGIVGQGGIAAVLVWED